MNNLKYYFCAFMILLSTGLCAEKRKSDHSFEMNGRVYITAHGLLLLECDDHTYIISKLDHSPNCQCKKGHNEYVTPDLFQRD